MTLQMPIQLLNGRPVTISGQAEYAQAVETLLGTDEGTFYPNYNRGIYLPMFAANVDLEDAAVFEITREFSENMPEVSINSIDVAAQGNSITYTASVSKGTQLVRAQKTVLL